jgi:hypothetical protein
MSSLPWEKIEEYYELNTQIHHPGFNFFTMNCKNTCLRAFLPNFDETMTGDLVPAF